MLGAIKSALDQVGLFLGGVARRFVADDGLRAASALSYTSILSLVPLLAVLGSLAGVFPASRDMAKGIEDYLLGNFLPDLGLETANHLRSFIGNAGQLGVLSAVVLTVTAAMTLSTIEHTLNQIWRVTRPRPPLQRVLVYWTMVTLGPLLFGASLSLSGYAFALSQRVGFDASRLPLGQLTVMLPWVLELIAFTLLYTVIPSRAVRLRHGLIGAVSATIAFEALKKGFAVYVVGAVDYRTLYGALASVPLFLVWTYLTWAVLLLGAEVAAFLPEWNAHRRGLGGAIGSPRRRLRLAAALLAALARQARAGGPLTRKQLRRALPVPFTELDEVLAALEEGRFVARESEQWWLARDLVHTDLRELLRVLGLSAERLVAAEAPDHGPAWLRRLHRQLTGLSDAERAVTAVSLAELLAEEPERAAAAPPAAVRSRAESA